MDLQISGGVAVVTGGGSGIGRASALLLASEGVKVAILDLDLDQARTVVRELTDAGADAIAVQADVSDEDSTNTAVDCVAEHFGGIDYLILCAGISNVYGKSIEEITATQWDHLFGVNVRGQWLPVKYAVPYLRKSIVKPAISIVASDSALFASLRHVPYVASKGAVLMLTKALAVDLRADGIRVNCVCPSVVNTPQSRNDLGVKNGGYAEVNYPVHEPEDIARYLMLLISPVTATINAHPLVADFGYSAESNFPA